MNGLVLEGGARRCMFGAGVVDCLIDNFITFDYVAGVSAGAQIALDFLANQKGRSKSVIMPHNDSSTGFIGRYASDIEKIAYEYPYKQFPFDFKSFFESKTVCEIVATDCKTGEAVYFSEKQNEGLLLKELCASCSLPLIYPVVKIGDSEFVDGSIADSIPFERAFEQGCDKLIVVLAKPITEAATDYGKVKFFVQKKYGIDYPVLTERLLDRYKRYNDQCERLYDYEKQGRVIIIRPHRTYVKSFERSCENLETAYSAGYNQAKSSMTEIIDFLSVN